MKINYQKHIWEGWTVQCFIDDLEPMFDMIVSNNSHSKPFENIQELKIWCMDNQPYYKKYIPEVVEHFAKIHNLN